MAGGASFIPALCNHLALYGPQHMSDLEGKLFFRPAKVEAARSVLCGCDRHTDSCFEEDLRGRAFGHPRPKPINPFFLNLADLSRTPIVCPQNGLLFRVSLLPLASSPSEPMCWVSTKQKSRITMLIAVRHRTSPHIILSNSYVVWFELGELQSGLF